MTRTDKLLQRMARAPQGDWTMDDVRGLCEAHGARFRRGTGSHVTISHPALPEILTVPAHRPIKAIYIRKLVRFVQDIRDQEGQGSATDDP